MNCRNIFHYCINKDERETVGDKNNQRLMEKLYINIKLNNKSVDVDYNLKKDSIIFSIEL